MIKTINKIVFGEANNLNFYISGLVWYVAAHIFTLWVVSRFNKISVLGCQHIPPLRRAD